MSKVTTVEVYGVRLSAYYEFTPAERQTRDDPGCSASADIIEVYLHGSDEDIIELLDPSVIEEILSQIFDHEKDLAEEGE